MGLTDQISGGFVQLPQLGGMGYYPYSPGDRQFGTPATIQALQEVAGMFRFNLPGVEIGIGDISFALGGPMSPHHSHQNGTDADIRPIRKGGSAHLPVTIADANYDRDLTRLLVECFSAHRNVRKILFNDAQIPGVTHWAGHDNHLHVIMRR